MKAARERLISDIDHVAEFGHPAIDRQDDAAALEWIRTEIRRVYGGPVMTAKTYDPACYELASRFLSDWPEKNTEENRDQLAALIQRTIEDQIEFGMEAVALSKKTP